MRKKNFTSPFWNSLGANIRNGRSSYHFDISSLSREIKMKASLARRTEQEWRWKSRRVRTHHSTSRVAVRRLGRIIQRIFLPNQEAALVEPFGNGLVRVGSQGLFSPCKHTTLHFFARFIFSRPWVSEDGSAIHENKPAGKVVTKDGQKHFSPQPPARSAPRKPTEKPHRNR